MVADALSREPFVQSCISHRLVTEPYTSLLNQVSGMVDRTVQDAFKCTTNCQLVVDQSKGEAAVTLPSPQGSLLSQDVSAVLDAHDSGGVRQMRATGPAIPQLAGVDQTASLPRSELVNLQEQDDVLGRALFYIQCHRRPTRRERADESRGVMELETLAQILHQRRHVVQGKERQTNEHDNSPICCSRLPESPSPPWPPRFSWSSGAGSHTFSCQAEVLLHRDGT